ncbi:MAG: hypothetical protein WD824_13590, partial [Cyclobacteriaceae bacterium]
IVIQFQFYHSAINSNRDDLPDTSSTNFNSTIVRLTDIIHPDLPVSKANFNSTIVRLTAVKLVQKIDDFM